MLGMTDLSTQHSTDQTHIETLPDRLCTWCKVAMTKRSVASGQFIHYTCPKCVFQHTTKRAAKTE